jgi:PPOX class probable F420-dependent enzyme
MGARMTDNLARERFASARVARLATVEGDGRPHLVPITFALLARRQIVTAVDHKPKRTAALQRLANIAANPDVCVLVDHYEDDWGRLWWVRADGRARVLGTADDEPEVRERALAALASKYREYRERAPAGALIVVDVTRFSGWTATESGS